MTFVENRTQGGSSTYADDGTASHEWASRALKSGRDAEAYLGETLTLNGVTYAMDGERAMYVQVYLDWARANTGPDRIVELRLQMRPMIDTDGTADVAGYNPETGEIFVGDLKYGMGERVLAEMNSQGLCYGVGMLNDLAMLGETPKTFRFGICQPRLDHIDEWSCTVEDLVKFAYIAHSSIEIAKQMIRQVTPTVYNPGDKTCRWCRAKALCPELAKFTQAAVAADFETIVAKDGALPPSDTGALSTAFAALPLIQQWVDAVEKEVAGRVAAGEKVQGRDGQPLKFVSGRDGKRVWKDKALAEQMLVGQLGPKAYKPAPILTAPEAAKLLDKKKTAELWKLFDANIHRAPGKPVLALGSDERPAFTGNVATADEFEDIPE
jgi:hypothetical protein